MDERLRQRYLKQMGFTPWVATTPLPGAAPSPVLDVVAPAMDDDTGAEPETVAALREPLAAPSPPVSPAPIAAPVTPVEEPAGPALRFTLQAHRGTEVHVWVEQQDPEAPGLTREEQQLLGNLLRLFGGMPQADARRLICAPTAGQPMTAELARPTFDLFQRRLLGRGTEARLLLCARATTVEALFGVARYEPVLSDRVTVLPVSSLAEMLADPAGHKAPSWQAMKRHGLA